MQGLVFFIFALFFFHEVLYYIYLWQVKEYRRDRMAAGLRTRHDFLKTLLNSFNLLVWFRPKPTFRVFLSLTLALTLSLLFFIFLLPITYPEYFLLILLAPFFSPLAVAILTPFFVFWKKHLVEKATDKMREFGGTVIGISGSFGKSSTKEILAWLLSDKFSVLKTKKNVNSAIGLAKTILHDLKGDEQFFICEMGAYRRGEISEMCEMVKPKAGILTGLGDQHLDMFGSLENIKKAKMELIDSLPPTGFGIVLGRDFFESDAENIHEFKDHLEFDYSGSHFKVAVLGKSFVTNAIAAVKMAEHFGFTTAECAARLSLFKSDDIYPKLVVSGETQIVDNTYNSSFDSFVAALSYLNNAFPDSRRVVVTPGIIELGQRASHDHAEIGKKLKGIERVFLTTPNYFSEMNVYNNVVILEDRKKLIESLRKLKSKNTVFLLQGRVGEGIIQKVSKPVEQ